MKIAVPTNGESTKDQISKSFGRAKNFIIVDSDSMDFDILANTQNVDSAQGAGIQAAQMIIKAGADILITLNCGPKAYKVLSTSGMLVYTGVDENILQNVSEYKASKLKSLDDANVDGHWV